MNTSDASLAKAPQRAWPGWKMWALLFGIGTLLGLMEAAQAYIGLAVRGRPLPWGRALLATLPSWYVLALLVPLVFWLARRHRFEVGNWRSALKVHVPAALLFPVVHLGLTGLASAPLLNEPDLAQAIPEIFGRLLTVYFVIDIFFYAALLGIYYMLDFYRMFQERALAASTLQLKTSRLETSLAQANLNALKMQLQPHFLFNTLNAISVLAMKGENDSVVRMLGRLSELLRITLDNTAQMVPLEEELLFLHRYLGIEQVRFQDRLTVTTDVAPDTLGAEVPSLVLQPLVENAVRHGIARQTGAGRIEIHAHRENGSLEMRVRDTGPGLRQSLRSSGTGVGLANTRARLEQIYGADYQFELTGAEGGGAEARIVIPFRVFEGEK